jgi:Na+/H+-dicarboxylate symporter
MVNAEVLPLIIFSLVFGGVLTTLGERAQIIIRFFEGVNEAIMGMVHILIGGQSTCFITNGWRDSFNASTPKN